MNHPEQKPDAGSNVKQMPMRQAPAIGVSTVLNVGPDRQLTLQGFVAIEDGPQACDALLDRLFGHVDRIKARYDIIALEEEITKLEKEFKRFNEDFEAAEARRGEADETREAEVKKWQDEKAKRFKAAYDRHAGRGKAGEFIPQGSEKQALKACDEQIARIKIDGEKQDRDREQNIQEIEKSRTRFREEIAARKSGIKKRRRVIEGLKDAS